MDAENKNLIRIEHASIVLNLDPENLGGYPIEFKRMNTPEKLLGWIHHLAKKGLVTKEHIIALIESAKDMGVNIDFHS